MTGLAGAGSRDASIGLSGTKSHNLTGCDETNPKCKRALILFLHKMPTNKVDME